MYWLSPWLTLNTARLQDGSTSSEAYWQPNSMTIHPLAQEYLSACVHDQRIINLSRLDYWSDKSMPWKWAGKLIGISTTFHSLLTKMQQIQSTLYFKIFFVINLSENKYVHFKSNYHQKKKHSETRYCIPICCTEYNIHELPQWLMIYIQSRCYDYPMNVLDTTTTETSSVAPRLPWLSLWVHINWLSHKVDGGPARHRV